MHNPVGFGSFRRFSDVENEGFLYADLSSLGGDDLISSGGFPVTGAGDSVRARSVWVLSVSWAEEIPFFLSKYCFAFTNQKPRYQ